MERLNKGNFYRILFPSVVELIFSQLFSMVDSVMVEHIPDSTVAVAALSLCGSPINLIICVMNAFLSALPPLWHGITARKTKKKCTNQSLSIQNNAWISAYFRIGTGRNGIQMVPQRRPICTNVRNDYFLRQRSLEKIRRNQEIKYTSDSSEPEVFSFMSKCKLILIPYKYTYEES